MHFRHALFISRWTYERFDNIEKHPVEAVSFMFLFVSPTIDLYIMK